MRTSINVNFTKNNTNKKDEIELGFFVRGALSDEQIIKLARLKQVGEVIIEIRTAQADIDDFERERTAPYREGIRGKLHQDGTIDVEERDKQLSIDDAEVLPAANESENEETTEAESDIEGNGDEAEMENSSEEESNEEKSEATDEQEEDTAEVVKAEDDQEASSDEASETPKDDDGW